MTVIESDLVVSTPDYDHHPYHRFLEMLINCVVVILYRGPVDHSAWDHTPKAFFCISEHRAALFGSKAGISAVYICDTADHPFDL